jgi:catechol 2,3-dioxygenase-like lactoylglutathione lyase family enzyme
MSRNIAATLQDRRRPRNILEPHIRSDVTMHQSLAHIALIVRDYDEAIGWFTGKLGFTLVADEYQAEQDKRWVLVAPPGAGSDAATLLLARASTPEQEAFIGNQAGGRVFLFLKTDDFERDYEALSTRGVRFVREPKEQPYGKVAVFEDLYGNLWDLVQFAAEGDRAQPRFSP